MKIDEIINRYFDGLSSTEDERLLREYLLSSNVSAEHKYLQPIFEYMADETEAIAVLNEIRDEEAERREKSRKVKRLIVSISSVAASLIVGMFLLVGHLNLQKSKSYVWVDGKKIYDPEVVTKYFENAVDNVTLDNNIIEEQLSAMFDD